MQEIVTASGHKNVRSAHRTTVEITKHKELGLNGDCIIATGADKACADLGTGFREMLKNEDTVLKIRITAGGKTDTITAYGSKDLTLTHKEDMVIRKSDYTCPRTLAIGADKAACDLDRELVEKLAHDGEKATIEMKIEKRKQKKGAPPLHLLEKE